MSTKHTPGPWEAIEVGQTDAGPNGIPVCEVYTADAHRRICEFVGEADSRLIAAAPDLLAALQRLLPAYREAVKLYDSNHDDAFTVDAHNAIAKALGSAA